MSFYYDDEDRRYIERVYEAWKRINAEKARALTEPPSVPFTIRPRDEHITFVPDPGKGKPIA